MSAETVLAGFLSRRDPAVQLNISERTLHRWRRLGEGPPVTKVGRRIYYQLPTVREWLRAREQQSVVT
jgi:predicted site-specific integrase-resolvase